MIKSAKKYKMNKALFLNLCCAPCSTVAFERLPISYNITGFYYNPNIYPEAEYKKRLDYVKKLSILYKIPLNISNYDNQLWINIIKPYENTPERGERCFHCISLRINKTAETAKLLNINKFSTTLSVSPHKDINMINKAGKIAENNYGIEFVSLNLKKQNGYKQSIELSKKHQLYRQSYCGCIYSLNEMK